MARPAQSLPSPLVARPFTNYQAAVGGVTRARLERRSLVRTTFGARSMTAPRDGVEHVRGVLVALPEDVAVSHVSAARLWRLPVPMPWSVAEPVHTTRSSDRTPLRRRGVVGHRGLELRRTEVHRGIRVVSRPDTWCDLGASWALDDLVVLGDAILQVGITVEAVDAAISSRASLRAAVVLREARSLLRSGSRSPTETKARLLFGRAGLPEPELNADIRHDHEGHWMAIGDFVWRAQRVVGEYAGDHHRTDIRQWRADVARREDLEDEGWRMVVMTAEDVVARPAQLVARLDRLLRPR